MSKLFIFLSFYLITINSIIVKTPDKVIAPPFKGTIFVNSEIITSRDKTTYVKNEYYETALRKMYDRRVSDWIKIKPIIFKSYYYDSDIIEFQVNPEFGSIENAKSQVDLFAPEIGRLPIVLRKYIKTVWIHKGLKPFGGGNENILIHTDWFEKHYKNQGILEETLFHEASHTSLDSLHANKLAWIDAQNKDNNFISEYAREFPNREDIAESYLLYFALKYKREILSDSTIKKIENSIPNRIKYFENQNFEIYPF